LPTNTESDSKIKTYYVYAGSGSGYIESLESCGKISIMVSSATATTTTTTETTTETTTKSSSSLGVQDDYVSDYMKSLKVSNTSVDVDDYVTITAKTTKDVNRIKVTNNYNDKNSVASTYDKDGDYRTFTVKTKLTQKGTIKLYVYVSTDNGGYEDDYQTIIVKVVDDDDDSDTDYGDLEIIDIETPIEDVYKGETARITVYTSKDISEVAIYNSDDERMASSAFTSKKYSNKYKWILSFEMDTDETEKYTVYAYDDDGNETKDTFKLDGDSYSKSSLVVLDVEQKTKDVEEGEDCSLVVRATKSATKVAIKTKSGKELASTEKSSTSGSVKEFKLTIEASDSDTTYVAYAYNDDDDSNTRKFTLDVSEAELPEINSVDISDTTVDEGDDVDVTVYTNKAVEKIWIEDSSGDKVSKRLTKPDKEKSDEYVWELDFTADKSGSRVSYVVIAQGEDKDDTDEYDFKIKVEDD
jgi:uncharacterized protein YrzB (UPF0473 family)